MTPEQIPLRERGLLFDLFIPVLKLTEIEEGREVANGYELGQGLTAYGPVSVTAGDVRQYMEATDEPPTP